MTLKSKGDFGEEEVGGGRKSGRGSWLGIKIIEVHDMRVHHAKMKPLYITNTP